MNMKHAIGTLAVVAGVALASSGALAQGMQLTHPHPVAHPPLTHKPAPAPKPPAHGAHAFTAHGKAAYLAVQAHAKAACEHLAHHFVGTAVHGQFFSECMNTHLGAMTHIRPHPEAAKG